MAMALVMSLTGCQTTPPPEASNHHLKSAKSDTRAGTSPPAIVSSEAAPYLPPPRPDKDPDRFTAVVHNVPVRELLFTLARDAKVNVDIHPGVTGLVSINAVEQTLPQILERLSDQLDIRYTFKKDSLLVSPDLPYWNNYKVDYLNLARTATSTVGVELEVGSVGESSGTGGGNNASNSSITNTMNNDLWTSLIDGIGKIIELDEAMKVLLENQRKELEDSGGPQVLEKTGAEKAQESLPTATGKGATKDGKDAKDKERLKDVTTVSPVVANKESGVVAVYGTKRQQQQVQTFIDRVMNGALKQVLIEATVVEVTLSRDYQTGIDWSRLTGGSSGSSLTQSVMSGNLSSAPFISFAYSDTSSKGDAFNAELKLLEDFGEVRVLSSPKIMAVNNQAAILKVVDQKVYFEMEKEEETNAETNVTTTTTTTTVKTVPVGLVMVVQPQVSDEGVINLTVRPSLTRIIRMLDVPTDTGISATDNQVPEIQVREMESVLRVADNQMVILGGLMNDTYNNDVSGLPVLSDVPGLGKLFSYTDRAREKTELAIFMRPTIVRPGVPNDRLKELEKLLVGDVSGGEKKDAADWYLK